MIRYAFVILLTLSTVAIWVSGAQALDQKPIETRAQQSHTETRDSAATYLLSRGSTILLSGVFGDGVGIGTPPATSFTIGATGLSPHHRANGVSFNRLMNGASSTEPHNGVVYFTPRLVGFQVGVSYNAGDKANPIGLADPVMNSIDVGLSYSSDVGPMGLTLFVGSDGGVDAYNASGGLAQESEWGVGGQLKLGAFSVDAEIFRDGASRGAPLGEAVDWTVGLAFRTASWGVSLGYAQIDATADANARLSQQDQVELHATYELGEGAVLSSGAKWWHQEAADAGAEDDVFALVFDAILLF